MPRKTIWISYDLGVRGDYENMYAWLDSHGAKECGDSLAVLTYEYSGPLLDALKKDIEGKIQISNRARIYVIRRRTKDKANLVSGTFIFGSRRDAPWSGYAPGNKETEDDDN